MDNNDIKKIMGDVLSEWGGNITSQDPFPNADGTPEDVEGLTSDENGAGGGNVPDLTTHTPGPSDPQNRVGSDRTKVVEEADEMSSSSSSISKTTPAPKAPTSGDPNVNASMTAPDMQMDPAMMGGMPPGGGMGAEDPSMMGMGMGMTPGPQSPIEVGRIYELKKIYSRLVSMQSYLAGSTDVNLIKLRNYVSNTMDLFRTLISNIALYKGGIDEIILVFYKVVDEVYEVLSKYYKDKDTGKMVKAVD